jgi:hypothetical protein
MAQSHSLPFEPLKELQERFVEMDDYPGDIAEFVDYLNVQLKDHALSAFLIGIDSDEAVLIRKSLKGELMPTETRTIEWERQSRN